MIDFSLTNEQQKIIEKYRDFADRVIRPNRLKYDKLAEFPWEIVKKAYDEGIMNGPMPKKFGGSGFNIFDSALTSEELGAGCIGIGICIDANTLALTPMLLAADEKQQDKFFGQIVEEKAVAAYCLTEPNAGSDVQGIKSSAILKGDKYILNGHNVRNDNPRDMGLMRANFIRGKGDLMGIAGALNDGGSVTVPVIVALKSYG